MAPTPLIAPSFLCALLSIIFFRHPDNLPSQNALQVLQAQANSNGDQSSGNAPSKTSVSIHSKSIPDEISFDRMMAGGTYPPVTKTDFMSFLKTVNVTEYLEFLMCLEHYVKLFEAVGDQFKSFLNPTFTQQDEDDAGRAVAAASRVSHAIFRNVPITYGASNAVPQIQVVQHESSDVRTDLPTSPAVIQHLRQEGDWIKNMYILPGSPQELNLDHRTREILLHALGHSNHPSAFNLAAAYATEVLRRQYTEFIKISVPKPKNNTRLILSYVVGFSLLVAGIVCSILMILSSRPRVWRALGFPLFSLGSTLLYAAYRRLAVIMFPLGHYQLKPWHLETNNDAERLSAINPSKFLCGNVDPKHRDWVGRYNRRFLIRQIFDKEGPIQDARLRYGELILVGQALWMGVLCGVALVGICLGIPPAGLW